LTWRHFGSTLLEKASDQPLLNDNGKAVVREVDRRLPRINYLDLHAAYNLTRNISLSAGINNVLDKDPPITSQIGTGQGNGNTFPSMYDAMGRKIFLNMTAKF
jgi:outer membrane receptor protein involved in Fe transport